MQYDERGMVTVELALISILVAGLVGLVGWLGLQLLVFDQCQLAADEIARQAARGDSAAVARVSAAVPPGAVVSVSDADGATTVVVTLAPRLLGVQVTELAARATVLDEVRG